MADESFCSVRISRVHSTPRRPMLVQQCLPLLQRIKLQANSGCTCGSAHCTCSTRQTICLGLRLQSYRTQTALCLIKAHPCPTGDSCLRVICRPITKTTVMTGMLTIEAPASPATGYNQPVQLQQSRLAMQQIPHQAWPHPTVMMMMLMILVPCILASLANMSHLDLCSSRCPLGTRMAHLPPEIASRSLFQLQLVCSGCVAVSY